MTWGIYDTVDGVWLGDESGPKTFDGPDAYMLARIAAQLMDERMRQPANRTVAKEYDPGPKRLHDSVTPKMTGLQALRRLEGK